MQKEKYYYELAYLVKPDLTEVELKELTEKVEALCSKEKAILKSETAKRIRLAYPIKKQKEAFFVFVHFHAEPETVISLKKELADFNQIIRLLIVKKRVVPEPPVRLTPTEVKTPQEEQSIQQPVQEETTEPKEKPKKEKKVKEPAKKKVSMEEIEKDLDKILGE
ncbi:MAG: 30S ribosomal protein S6 [Candidatus Gribaldobacteria bacterium]|nr:30S ribosomal protein S6 [Candidatus Gribaldobacteria bacterium]